MIVFSPSFVPRCTVANSRITVRLPISTYETDPSLYLRSCVFMPMQAYGNIWQSSPIVECPRRIAPCCTTVRAPIFTSGPTLA